MSAEQDISDFLLSLSQSAENGELTMNKAFVVFLDDRNGAYNTEFVGTESLKYSEAVALLEFAKATLVADMTDVSACKTAEIH